MKGDRQARAELLQKRKNKGKERLPESSPCRGNFGLRVRGGCLLGHERPSKTAAWGSRARAVVNGRNRGEAGGISTDQVLAGFEVPPAHTRDGAIRVTYEQRDSEGVILDCRGTTEGSGRHLYSAQNTGKNLYIANSPPEVSATKRLINEPVADELRARDEHTLEFRFEGGELTAILDSAHSVSTRPSLLKQGPCAVVHTKGVLVKKVETLALDSAR